MITLQIKTPAKVNLTLEIIGKRPDGFHNIQSIMQAVNIFDILSFEIKELLLPCSSPNVITLSGNSDLIPYDDKNLVYKAAAMFFDSSKIVGQNVAIYIEKNIPVAAGLAGGSSNAAGTLVGLNTFYNKPLSDEQINQIASTLGSDLNFCIEGGTQVATSRGEVLEKISTPELHFIVIKPKTLFISAKEAYTKYSQMSQKPSVKNSQAMIGMIKANDKNIAIKISELLNNDLESSIIEDYPQIKELKKLLKQSGCLNAIMSGSGPTVFGICDRSINIDLGEDFDIFKAQSINYGVKIKK
jgi:4-diphosphocytidyl-2-C-methyl-D-erythritol kinase